MSSVRYHLDLVALMEIADRMGVEVTESLLDRLAVLMSVVRDHDISKQPKPKDR